jgi:hypothetical protein
MKDELEAKILIVEPNKRGPYFFGLAGVDILRQSMDELETDVRRAKWRVRQAA